MKNIARNLLLLGCAGSPVFAAPFLAIGDNAELFVTADAIAAYNDNILLASSAEEEDVVFTFRPGFDLQFGKNSLVKGYVAGTTTLTSYTDNDELNNQLFGIGGRATYDNGRLSLGANASFNQLDQPTIDVIPTAAKLVERHVTTAGVEGEVVLSEKVSIGAGVSYNHTDYKDAAYTDQFSYTVPLNAYYELTPKVDLSAGVRYNRTDLDGPPATPPVADQYDSFYYNVGARGSFTPKLSGSFSVGYTTRSANAGQNDDDSVGADASLAYAYSEKTQFNLTLGRNFSNSASGGSSYEDSQISLRVVNAIAVDWRLSASATYRVLDYQTTDRKDDYIEGSVGATYIINGHLDASLGYTYRQNSSDAAGADFENNLVSLSLSARY
jgi:hypothetical protein